MLAQTFVMALAALPFFAQQALGATNATCARPYTVKDGDNCDSICAQNSVSTYQLAVNNRKVINAACTNLVIGDSLCLGYVNEDCKTTYVIKAGDTCDSISSASGASTDMLYKNNPQIGEGCNNANIWIDEVLCTARHVEVPDHPRDVSSASTPIHYSYTPTSTATATVATTGASTGSNDDDLEDC